MGWRQGGKRGTPYWCCPCGAWTYGKPLATSQCFKCKAVPPKELLEWDGWNHGGGRNRTEKPAPKPTTIGDLSASPKPAESEGLHLEHRRGWLPWNSKSRSRNRQITRDRQPNPNWSRTRSCLLTWSLMLMSLLWLKSSIGIRTPRRPGGHGNSICLMALHNTTSRIRSPHDDTGSSAHPVGVTVVRTRATFHHCCRAISRCPVWGCSPIGYWIGPGIGSQLQIVQSYAPGMSECDKYDSQLSRVCSIRPAKLDRRA